jgi:hypothetical protein
VKPIEVLASLWRHRHAKTAETLEIVAPMFVREFTPCDWVHPFGGILMMQHYTVRDVGFADGRLDFDEDVVDCSNRMLEATIFLGYVKKACALTIFPSRRWRTLRVGDKVSVMPGPKQPFQYIGNPIRLTTDGRGGVTVYRIPEFRIKSGCELGY